MKLKDLWKSRLPAPPSMKVLDTSMSYHTGSYSQSCPSCNKIMNIEVTYENGTKIEEAGTCKCGYSCRQEF